MPVDPSRSPALSFPLRPILRLPWIFVRIHWWTRSVNAARRRQARMESSEDERLLRVTRRWIDAHAELSDIDGLPEPEDVREAREAIRYPRRSTPLRRSALTPPDEGSGG